MAQTFVNSRFLVALEVHSIIAQKVPLLRDDRLYNEKYLQKFRSAI